MSVGESSPGGTGNFYRAVPMPEFPAGARVGGFAEVCTGYTAEMAVAEAARCRQCRGRDATCVEDCPLKIDIPGFIGRIAARDFQGASDLVLARNVFPGVCGRICPAESLCELRCPAAREGDAISIGHLERFVGDWMGAQDTDAARRTPPESAPHVAVVGAGPCGLSCAAALLGLDCRVTVLEAMGRPGGRLASRVPDFRLPGQALQREIEGVRRRGVHMRFNAVVGALFSLAELREREGFDAVFLAPGGGLPRLPDIPGGSLQGVFTGTEYLIRLLSLQADEASRSDSGLSFESVAVVGGGDEALDCARTALRLGAREVTVVYRRSMQEMPARRIEVERSQQEGVRFLFLAAPACILGGADNSVRRLECVETESGGAGLMDGSGLSPRPNTSFQLEAAAVIFCVGRDGESLIGRRIPELERDGGGRPRVEAGTLRTNLAGIFAGGEWIGSCRVSAAIRDGREAARAIGRFLGSDPARPQSGVSP